MVICSHYKRRGHRQERCWKLHPELKPKFMENANTQRDIHAYSSSIFGFRNDDEPTSDWLLDCGCSRHMAPSVSNSQPVSANSGVVMGNNETVHIAGRGSRSVSLQDKRLLLDDVLHVPRLGKNLLSIGQSTEKGLKFLFEDDNCKVYEQGVSLQSSSSPLSVIKKCKDNLYHTSKAVNMSSHQANFAQRQGNAQPSSIWHQRLAHLNDNDVRRLAANPVTKIKLSPSINTNPCPGCIMGKMNRGKFHCVDRPPESLHVMEISVIDLSGRLQTSSISGGSWYWMIILDKREGWRDVYFLKNKPDATDIIIQHDQKSIRKIGDRKHRIQTIRTDNGGEFISNRLKQYFLENGITHETIVPHVHEQVGDVERENRTLFEKA